MNHSFNIFLAQKYGIDESIFIQNLVLWTSSNAANGQDNNIHFQENRYWIFGTPEYFTRFFIYWKPRRIKDIIASCLKQELIIKGTFNKKGYDRTMWYSLSNKTLLEINLDKTCLKPAPVLIVRNPSDPLDEIRTMDQTESVSPIPYTKPYTKPCINIKKKNIKKKKDFDFEDEELSSTENGTTKSDYQANYTEIEDGHKQALEATTENTKSGYRKNQTKNNTELQCNNQSDIKSIKSIANKQEKSYPGFERFWESGMPRTNIKKSREIWIKGKLEKIADLICEDVSNRIKNHKPWVDGYMHSPVNYLKDQLWTDEIIPIKPEKNNNPPSEKADNLSNEWREYYNKPVFEYVR